MAAASGLLLVAAIIGIGGIMYQKSTSASVDPAAYRPLLETIAKGESNGNYNAYFSNAANSEIVFTKMTVADVLAWQENVVRSGSPSSAVGKYQIIRPTLLSLVESHNIDTARLFDEGLQDELAVRLLEKRGAEAYMSNSLSREEFAARLAQEWAALPKIVGDNPEQSYYAGDGLNKVQISIDEVFLALATIKK